VDKKFPQWCYPTNALAGNFPIGRRRWVAAPYNELHSKDDSNALFFATIYLKEEGKPRRKVGEQFVPSPKERLSKELYHRGQTWKENPSDKEIRITDEACIDVPNSKYDERTETALTSYLVDLGIPGKHQATFLIQEREKEMKEKINPLLWGLGQVRESAKWFKRGQRPEFSGPEFGQLFNVRGDFNLGNVDDLTLDQEPFIGSLTWQNVRYSLRDNCNNVYATFQTEGFKRFISGGVVPTPIYRGLISAGKKGVLTGDGILEKGQIRTTVPNVGFVRNMEIKVYDKRLATHQDYRLVSLIGNILRSDIVEGHPGKLRRTNKFETMTPDRLMQYRS